MLTRIFAAALFALLTVTAPARAATITWFLNAAPEFPDTGLQGETVTGFFDWSTVTHTPTAWSIIQQGPIHLTDACNATCVAKGGADGAVPNPFGFALFLGGVDLGITGGIAALDGPANLLQLNSLSHLNATGGGVVNPQIFGTIPAVVPLPAALPLFGSGVLALAGFAWRKKGKVSS